MKTLTNQELEEIKTSMESGVSIRKHFKENGLEWERGYLRLVVSQMKGVYGDEAFLSLRQNVKDLMKQNKGE